MTRIILNKMRMTATERRKTHVLASVTFPCISTNNVCAVATAQKMQHPPGFSCIGEHQACLRVCLRQARRTGIADSQIQEENRPWMLTEWSTDDDKSLKTLDWQI
jgi:hypothetical protein